MTPAVPDCMVTGFEQLIDGLVLPDPDDRHVLAADLRAGAQAIVTFNLDDFPAERLQPYNIDAKHPDEFVIDTIDLSPGRVATVVAEHAAALRNPPRSTAELLDTLRDQGLVRSVAKLRELFARLVRDEIGSSLRTTTSFAEPLPAISRRCSRGARRPLSMSLALPFAPHHRRTAIAALEARENRCGLSGSNAGQDKGCMASAP